MDRGPRMLRSRRILLTTIALGALATGLTSCAGSPEPVPTVTMLVTPSATPVPTATVTVTPAPPAPEIVSPEPDPVQTIDPNAEVVQPETAYANDIGAGPGATAAPTLDGAGTIVSYKVVQGDSFFDIAQRFEIPMQQLLKMNPRVTGLGENIYINQVINLDASTLG